MVSGSLTDSVLPGTRASYETGAGNYMRFMDLRGLPYWPVDQMWFIGWLLTLATSVAVPSMKVYMAGVRYFQELAGYVWHLQKNQLVRRALRYLKRKYPSKDKGDKVPVTTAVLKKILPLLKGWPVLADMSPDDRVFAVASVVGVSGFLRGGEFLASPRSGRQVLQEKMVSVREVSKGRALVIGVPQPKARWWLEKVEVPCCERLEDPCFCPVVMWVEYGRLRGRGKSTRPAFVTGDGVVLSREVMVSVTGTLMAQAGLRFVDAAGKAMAVKMASWRSGAVRSAVDAGVNEATIRAMGRWRSSAWMSYLLHSLWDVQGASRSMWQATMRTATESTGLRVEVCDIGATFVSDRSEENQEMSLVIEKYGQ